ncbi:MAG: hypothetical protein B6U97_01265 [Candidatus Altiarchaeales archaeon ex4484_96]|nr:MAG: hypothetical protein B6U97_01265 [Candidatus Altiarchaeales archaeon ex4484_96]
MDFNKQALFRFSRLLMIVYGFLIFATIILFLSLVFLEKEENPPVDMGFFNLSRGDQDYLVAVAYSAVNDYFLSNDSGKNWPPRFDNVKRKVFVGFRVDGVKRGSWSALRDNLAESVYVAAHRTLSDRRYGPALTEDELSRLKIEIFILGDYTPLSSEYEPGIHGLYFVKDDKQASYYNSVAIEGNLGLDTLMQKLCLKAGLDAQCSQNPDVEKYIYPTIHFASTRFTDDVVLFYRCNTPESNPNVSFSRLNTSLKLATDWFIVNLNDEGFFNYLYNPSNGKYSNSNNMIRQLMASRLLAELSSVNDSLLSYHQRNLDYVFSNWYGEKNECGYIIYDSKSKLGANAMALRALVYSPLFDEYEDKARRLANSIINCQNPDGSFKPFFIEPGYSYDEKKLLYYYSGEALLSLVELYERTGEKKYLDAAVKSQNHYLVEYVQYMDNNYYPALVPWHTMSLAKLYQLTGDERYSNAVFVLNDELIKMQNTEGEPYIDYLGRFYDPTHPEYGVPFTGSTSVYLEGLAYAHEIALLVDDSAHKQKYAQAIKLGVHNLINLQFRGPNMYYLVHPERVKGAIRYRVDDNRIRIDTTQHTIDAFRKIQDVTGF